MTELNKPSTDVFVHDADLPWEDLGDGVHRKILTYSKDMMMARVTFEVGAVGPLHTHPHHQVALVEAGAFDVTIEGRTKRLVAGDSYIVPSGALHGVVCVEKGILVDVFTPMREDFLG